MISFSKVKSFVIEKSKRILKVEQYGVKTAVEAGPFGEDSAPLKDMTAIFAETSNNAEPVIIAYINKNQKSAPGERRLYSLNDDGTESTYVWLKGNGLLEIGGDGDNMVRFSKMAEAFNQMKTDLDTLGALYNAHVHPGPNTPSTTATYINSTANINPAKIDEIKTS